MEYDYQDGEESGNQTLQGTFKELQYILSIEKYLREDIITVFKYLKGYHMDERVDLFSIAQRTGPEPVNEGFNQTSGGTHEYMDCQQWNRLPHEVVSSPL